MELKPYPKYKDSGVEWLGEIPEGWEVKRLRFLANIRKGKKPDENDESIDGLPYLTMDFLRGQQEPTYYMPSQESIIIENGEILLLWDGANAGEFVDGRKGILSSTMARVSFDIHKCHSKYCFYFLKAFEKLLRELTIGMGIPHVSGNIVKDCITPVFSIQHQQSIANFLDQKTTKIDELIKKNKRLVELLKEKRQAIISNAVTKGLDPKAKMKDSGIEWIGEIPEGWEVKRLKYAVRLINEKTEDVDSYELRIALENIEGFTGKLIDGCSSFEGGGSSFRKGDVLFNKLRPYLCKAVLTPQDGIAVGELLVFRPNEYLDGRFLFYRVLSSDFVSVVNGSTCGAKMPRASWEFIGNLKISLPSIDEQQAIANFLDQKTAKIDDLTQTIQSQIETLKEYRPSLISNVVTGKIKVIES